MKPVFRIIILMKDGTKKKLYTETLDGYDEWAEALMNSGKPVKDIYLHEITEEEAKAKGIHPSDEA